MIERLQCPDAPVTEDEAPDEEYGCSRCSFVSTGPDAWYELGAHEVEYLED